MIPALQRVQFHRPETIGEALFNFAVGLVDVGIQTRYSREINDFQLYIEGVPAEQNPAPERNRRRTRFVKVSPGVEYCPPKKSE